MKKYIMAISFLLVIAEVSGQNISAQQYIETYRDVAIAEMKRSGIPASITLAQGLLETESGNSDLVKRSNNHFGIKCKSNWTGESVTHTDDAPDECFRKYNSAADSYRDHSDFLKNNIRYSGLFKLEPNDYKGWAVGLKRAGYATNPRYPQILIRNIEDNNLQQYDLQAIAPEFDHAVIIDSNRQVKTIAIAPVDPAKEDIVIPVVNAKRSKSLFNSLKAEFILKGTSLLAVATRNNISLSRLLEYNDLEKDGLVPEDQWIYLEKKPRQGNRDYYIVLQNESLYQVAQNNAVQLPALMEYNALPQNALLKKGAKVNLRAGLAKDNAIHVNVAADQETKFHEVLPKEGLYSIARKYNISVAQIKAWNHLEDEQLYVGQKLIIAK